MIQYIFTTPLGTAAIEFVLILFYLVIVNVMVFVLIISERSGLKFYCMLYINLRKIENLVKQI